MSISCPLTNLLLEILISNKSLLYNLTRRRANAKKRPHPGCIKDSCFKFPKLFHVFKWIHDDKETNGIQSLLATVKPTTIWNCMATE